MKNLFSKNFVWIKNSFHRITKHLKTSSNPFHGHFRPPLSASITLIVFQLSLILTPCGFLGFYSASNINNSCCEEAIKTHRRRYVIKKVFTIRVSIFCCFCLIDGFYVTAAVDNEQICSFPLTFYSSHGGRVIQSFLFVVCFETRGKLKRNYLNLILVEFCITKN